MMMIWWLLTALGVLSPAAPVPTAPAPERRCGWLDNPTPQNFWLIDRSGEWTLSEQGGYEAEGMGRLPDMSTRGTVQTNGSHGYSCACMTVSTDRKTKRITRVYSGEPVPLRQCRADRGLERR